MTLPDRSCMGDPYELDTSILCLRDQNMMTVEDGYNTADDGGPLQIRESIGYEEQHSRSFHETS